MRTPGFGERRVSSTRGVLPISSSTERRNRRARIVDGSAGHRRQKDEGRARVDGGLEPIEGADVLAAEVDVDERRYVAVLEDGRAGADSAAGEIVEHLAHRLAVGLDLAGAADLVAQRGRIRTTVMRASSRGPAQNST